MICMLQVLVHNGCTICTIKNYGICTIIFLIVTVNMKYHIIVFIARDFVFYSDRFCMDLVCSRFCWVICSLSFYLGQRISWACVLHNLPSLAVASWTWTGTRIFDWDPHICRGCHVFTTAKLVLNNVLHHTVI